MSFLKPAKYFLVLSAILIVASVAVMIYPGPRLSIEFTGGTLMELQLPQGTTKDQLTKTLKTFDWKGASTENISIAETKTGTLLVRTPTLTNDQHTALSALIDKAYPGTKELQFTSIGPTVGASLEQRAIWAFLAASAAIIVYLAVAFRKVPRELSSWSFGVSAVLALVHDLVITMGIFTVLSYTTTFQMDTLFVSAMLTIMGYSVMDTIVIFDRIRENLYLEGRKEDFATIADKSLIQTLTRTMSTAVVTLIMLFMLFLFGAESIRWFMLALIVGTVIGTYSSFFIATPVIVYWRKKS